MNNHSADFKLFVIESPYECWKVPQIAELFYKMVLVKMKGYNSNYDNIVLPVDTTDFISTHVLLCASTDSDIQRPVMGYKVTTLSQAQHYDVTFPGLSLVQRAGTREHVQAVESIIENCNRFDRPLAYLGSWTVDPEFKEQFEAQTVLREMFIASYSQLFTSMNSPEVIIGGTIRFGTQKLFAQLGHKPLSWQGEDLAPIHVAHLAGEPVQVMHSPLHEPSFKDIVQKYQSLWEERELINCRKKQGVQAA